MRSGADSGAEDAAAAAGGFEALAGAPAARGAADSCAGGWGAGSGAVSAAAMKSAVGTSARNTMAKRDRFMSFGVEAIPIGSRRATVFPMQLKLFAFISSGA